MAGFEQPEPIWAASKAKKQVDILKEVSRFLVAAETERAGRDLGDMTQSDLELEQYRLEDRLDSGTITVDEFRRLREIDFYVHEMRERSAFGLEHQPDWPETLSD